MGTSDLRRLHLIYTERTHPTSPQTPPVQLPAPRGPPAFEHGGLRRSSRCFAGHREGDRTSRRLGGQGG